MTTTTAYSVNNNTEQAVNEIKNSFATVRPKMVLFFASSIFPGKEISKAMKTAFPDCVVMGCSTAGEIVTGKVLKNSLVAMALDESTIKGAKVAVVKDTKNNIKANVSNAFAQLCSGCAADINRLSPDEYVGLVLHDGMSGSEERVMNELGDITNIIFIGGSAGDDCKFVSTSLYAEGEVYSNASILALLKPSKGYDIIKTQSFRSTNKKLVATKVNEELREILEFNGRPAAEAYAEAFGVPVEKLPDMFMNHPVGINATGDFYVRSPQQVKNGKVAFYCAVKEGMEVTILEGTDIVEDTKKAVERKQQEIGSIAALVNFHCILRTLQLESEGKTEAYGSIFKDIPTLGFSTYGESYIGHINQTSTILVLK